MFRDCILSRNGKIEAMSGEHDPDYVAKKSYALVGQKAVLTNKKNEILVLKRSEKAGRGGFWSLPGGGIDFGEDAFDSMRREIREETGLEVDNLQPFFVRSYVHNKDFVVIIAYSGKASRNEVKLNWEHTKFGWIKSEEALKMKLSPDARAIIEMLSPVNVI